MQRLRHGAGVLSELSWLAVLALIIRGQELLETSVMAAALYLP